MRTGTSLLIATVAALGLAAAPAAQADWHHGWRGDRDHYHHDGGGVATGALIGLGVGALVGGAIVASQQPYYAPPPVAYAPPPVYYPAPAYAPPGY